MNTKRITAGLYRYRVLLLALVSMCALTAVYSVGLDFSNRPGPLAVAYRQGHDSLQAVLANPLGLWYALPHALVHNAYPGHAAAGRFVSAVWALVAAIWFFLLVRRWHGGRTATIMTIVFGLSGWLLHTGHLATDAILAVAMPLGLFLGASWLARTSRHAAALYAAAGLLAFGLLTPGGICTAWLRPV